MLCVTDQVINLQLFANHMNSLNNSCLKQTPFSHQHTEAAIVKVTYSQYTMNPLVGRVAAKISQHHKGERKRDSSAGDTILASLHHVPTQYTVAPAYETKETVVSKTGDKQ